MLPLKVMVIVIISKALQQHLINRIFFTFSSIFGWRTRWGFHHEPLPWAEPHLMRCRFRRHCRSRWSGMRVSARGISSRYSNGEVRSDYAGRSQSFSRMILFDPFCLFGLKLWLIFMINSLLEYSFVSTFVSWKVIDPESTAWLEIYSRIEALLVAI